MAARQETLCPSDPKDLRVPPANVGKLQLPEKHTSHNRKNDGYQPMDRSAKNAREHIGSRRMLRSRASQCQGYIFTARVFVRTTEQMIRANGVLRKKLAKKRRGRKQWGNNGVWSDEQPLSCLGIAQLTTCL